MTLTADDLAVISLGHANKPTTMVDEDGTTTTRSVDTIRPVTYHRATLYPQYASRRAYAEPACGTSPQYLSLYTVEIDLARAVAKPCGRCYQKGER